MWNSKLIRPFSKSAEVRCRGYSLLLERVITDFGSDTPFGQIPKKILEHYGIEIPESSAQQIAETHARKFYECSLDIPRNCSPEANCIIVEEDGSMVPIVSTEESAVDRRKTRKTCWKEAKLTMARKPSSIKKTVAATLGSVDKAGNQIELCAKSEGFGPKTKVHCVGDGAVWISNQIDRVFGTQATYLVDFYHVCEYLASASHTCSQLDPKAWMSAQKELLLSKGANEVISNLKPWIESDEKSDEEAPVRRCYRYLSNRLHQLDYAEAKSNNLPIGSGEVESGHGSIIQKRLKLPGCWWRDDTADHMLSLRCGRANGQWDTYWNSQQGIREAA